MSYQAVVFVKNNARVVHSDKPFVKGYSHHSVVMNPDLSEVKGIEPQYWKRGPGQKIIAMSEQERKTRDLHIDRYGVDNESVIESTDKSHVIFGFDKPSLVLGFSAGAFLVNMFWLVFKLVFYK